MMIQSYQIMNLFIPNDYRVAFTGQLLLIEISTIQPFTVILMHTGASPFFNNLPFLMKNNTENDFRAIFTSFLKLQNYVFSSKVSLCKML